MGGVSIVVTNTEWLTEYKNGVGFTLNLGDTAPNLQGTVGERVKCIRTVNLFWRFEGSTANPVSVTPLGGGLSQMTSGGATFASQGMAVGDNMVIIWTDNSGSGNAEDFLITGITANTLIAQQTAGPLPDSSSTGFSTASVSLIGREPQTALQYTFGLLESNESFNVVSKVSNNSQGYYSNSIGLGSPVRSTAFQTMQRLGQYEDWRTGTVRARFVQNTGFLNLVQVYEIEHEFIINPFYLDGELFNLQNNVTPPLLNGLSSLKYAFNTEFRTTLSNPNSAKSYQYEESLGSVAWFNENFNGFNVDYNVVSVTYEEKFTGAPASGILIGAETRIRIKVEKLSGAFVGAERFGAYISYLPDQSEYTNTTLSNLQDNFIYDNALNNAGAGALAGQTFISAMLATINAGDLDIVLDTNYAPIQDAFLAQKSSQQPTYFLLGIQVGDDTFTNAQSDRCILLADVEVYDQSPDIADLMHVTKYDIYPHNQQIGIGAGFTNMTSWNEDGLVVDFEFDLNLNLAAFLNSLEFKLVAYNPLTDQFWELDSYSFSPATAVVSGGVQQIIDSTTRNYILRSGDQFNDVEIGVGTQAAGLQKYSGRFAQKISWQEWLVNNGVDTVFFDATEPNNNFNDKASNYSALNNYEIRLAIFGNVSGTSPLGVSGITDYLFLSPDIKVYDYEEDGNLPPTWSCVIETFDAVNLTPLSGAILSGIDTLFRVTWTSVNAPILSLNDIWGINRIEVTNQPSYAITEMSSLNLPLPTGQQLLKPSVGTLLDMTIVGGNVVMECLIDGSLVAAGTNYNLSSRIHEDTQTPEGKATSPAGTPKDTSGTITSKVVAP